MIKCYTELSDLHEDLSYIDPGYQFVGSITGCRAWDEELKTHELPIGITYQVLAIYEDYVDVFNVDYPTERYTILTS